MFDGVSLDNIQGGNIAAEYLLSLGHKNIGIAVSEPDVPSVKMRVDAFLDKLTANGYPIIPRHIIRRKSLPDNILESHIKDIVKENDKPTAFFAINDGLAIRMMRIFKKSGLNVPDAMSVIGFDDKEISSQVEPPLTTIRQPAVELGRRAAEILVKRIHEKRKIIKDVTEISLKPEIVIRKSCVPLI